MIQFMKLLRVLALCCLSIAAGSTIFGAQGRKRKPIQPSSISQLVERRAGRISCWGLIIRFGRMRLKPTVGSDEIEIQEAKHSADLRNIMTWRVDDDGRRLIIKFKPGMGDFGNGNNVTVRLSREAFAEPASSLNNWYEWSINTDIM
ncbi:MAG: hypothetical protein QOF61_347 [Acidobacteriota bacterium]|jgi:hypothetical protein|nr:hypothetical protein [Acidobacteriota bacterium]